MKPFKGLGTVGKYRINIYGLSQKVHQFDYEIGSAFFQSFGTDLVKNGAFTASITLDKHETFLEARFYISGVAELICDRSLEVFDYPIEINSMILFKYGEERQEISDEIVIIPRDTVSLEMGQYLYEFIGLAIPMKKLHPRFQEEEEEEDEEVQGKLIYSSTSQEEETPETDPRWDILKKLK